MAALCGCAIVYALIYGHHVYAPGARQLQQRIASYDDFSNPILNSYWLGQSIYFAVRKFYGAVAFLLLGFCTSAIFARTHRIVYTAVLIAIARTGLEIFERLIHRGDSTIESLFDIAVGTSAGALGAIAYNAIVKRAT